ncbi:MAG TPA: DUF308 domain-containing protein [Candidatus Faecousia intestinigallinarum]|nr:DUF308 domain-containing protein [Candidatus Faecousia intestinigallinarum]
MGRDTVKFLFQKCLGPIGLLLAGLVLLCNPDLGSAAAAVILGWLLSGLGAAGIVLSLVLRAAGGALASLAGLVCGVYILRHPLSLAVVLGVGLGIYLGVQGLSALRDGLRLKRLGYPWLWGTVLGAGMVLSGIVLIFSPLITSRLLMTALGLGLLVLGGLQLAVRLWDRKYLEENGGERIIDADE